MDQLPVGVLWIVIGFVVKEIYDWAKNKLHKQDDNKDGQLEENTKAIHTLNICLVKFEGKLDLVVQALKAIPKLEKKLFDTVEDLAETKAQMREVRASLKTRT